jgi:hypothetical protein
MEVSIIFYLFSLVINHANWFLSSIIAGAMLAIHRAELFPLDNGK